MLSRSVLLTDLQRLLKKLEADLRVRAAELPEVDAALQAQHREAVEAKRTGTPFKEWREEIVTQVGVAWILGCVFVRFLEDNAFLDAPFLSGPGDRRALAADQHTAYVRAHPTDSDREYLQHVFRTVAALPVLGGLFDPQHNPLWLFGPSADGAQALLTFWQQTDAATGALRHDFTDPTGDTRFLGDLYQDLSEAARDHFALLQTPVFVEEFILERTLDPAIETFGLATVRMIDPTCGSGHFLLGSFARLLDRWQRAEPGTNPVELVRRSLDAVHGVDLNPFAVAIARFRLLVAALRASGIARVRSAPAWPIHVAAGDSLLFGPEPGQHVAGELLAAATRGAYRTEDAEEATHILSQGYHAVVGNPPYITVKDKVLNQAYRSRFASCHRSYSLSVPFFERFFDLAVRGDGTGREPAGYVGQITANSFMKREFGKKLVESFIPRWDLTHIIDTAGAYLPGHGTPTVIVFGRHQSPVAPTVRAVMGIKGEPSTPADPTRGLVWQAIIDQVDRPGSESDFLSVAETTRTSFHKHPWSIGGGGAAELKEQIDAISDNALFSAIAEVGYGAVTREDEAFAIGTSAKRKGIPARHCLPFVTGEDVRDWCIPQPLEAIWPYDPETLAVAESDALVRILWPYRASLSSRVAYGMSQLQRGLSWYEYSMFFRERFRANTLITFPEIATHPHFVIGRNKMVFTQTAPVIRLPAGTTEDDHLGLLGLLNSSTACFWLKQVCFPKGGDHQGSEGARVRSTLWDERYAFNSTQVSGLPLCTARPLEITRELDRLAQELQSHAPGAVVTDTAKHSRAALDQARADWSSTLARMIALQEELDWQVYGLYSLTQNEECRMQKWEDTPALSLGERAFEIALARRVAAGKEQTAWFERHSSTPITKLPAHWSAAYRTVVERRLQLLEKDRNIALIERPEYKRRWNVEPWDAQLVTALRSWLLDRLETYFNFNPSTSTPTVTSTSALSEHARKDAEFMRVAELSAGRPDFDVAALVAELVEDESVPSLPGQRYKDTGLRKRSQWEETWAKQRQEDAITARLTAGLTEDEKQDPKVQQSIRNAVAAEVGEILVPPKYTSADFRSSSYWRLRGKLDVPKERWISYPGLERTADQSLPIAWAGWDHLQQAKALAAHYQTLQSDGAPEPQLARALASLHQLIPWLLQWHNELDADYGLRMGDYFQSFVADESRRLHLTPDDLTRLATTK